MGLIHKKIDSLSGYLISIKRDTLKGWYYLEVGLPANWIFKGNDIIDCETLHETKEGYLIKIAPKDEEVSVDDLIKFTQIILNTNFKILSKQQEFEKKINSVKTKLNSEKEDFYKKLDDLKEKSFSTFDNNVNKQVIEKKKTTKQSTSEKQEEPEKDTTNKTTTIDSKDEIKDKESEEKIENVDDEKRTKK